MTRRTVAVVATLLALAGCGSDAAPSVEAEPTPSASATPVATEPSSPPAAETPEAFIRRWARASMQMQNTGDVDPFDALNDPACQPCRKLSELVVHYYSAGGRVTAKAWTFVSFRAQNNTTFEVDVRTMPTRIRASEGAAETETDGGPVTFEMTLKMSPDGWRMVDYVQLAR